MAYLIKSISSFTNELNVIFKLFRTAYVVLLFTMCKNIFHYSLYIIFTNTDLLHKILEDLSMKILSIFVANGIKWTEIKIENIVLCICMNKNLKNGCFFSQYFERHRGFCFTFCNETVENIFLSAANIGQIKQKLDIDNV